MMLLVTVLTVILVFTLGGLAIRDLRALERRAQDTTRDDRAATARYLRDKQATRDADLRAWQAEYDTLCATTDPYAAALHQQEAHVRQLQCAARGHLWEKTLCQPDRRCLWCGATRDASTLMRDPEQVLT